jgi:hypothetical protein
MAKQKMEWLKDYKELRIEMSPVPDRTGLKTIEEYEASNELVEYKKGRIINVEKRDRNLFRDIDGGFFFAVSDPSAYRLF